MKRRSRIALILSVAFICIIAALGGYWAYARRTGRPYIITLSQRPAFLTDDLAVRAANEAMAARDLPLTEWRLSKMNSTLAAPDGSRGPHIVRHVSDTANVGVILYYAFNESGGEPDLCLVDVKLDGDVVICVVRPQ